MAYSPKVLKIISSLKLFLNEEETIKNYRTQLEYFTRKSKMDFPTYALMGVSLFKKSLSVEIFNTLEMNNIACISKSAYSQARYKIRPEFYQAFDSLLLDLVYGFSHTDSNTTPINDTILATKKWRGYFLDAVDGSAIVLPKTASLIAKFGTHGSQVKSKAIRTTMAKILVRTDLLNEYVVQHEVFPTKESELTICKGWLYQLNSEAISIFDRGFGNAGIFYFLVQTGKPFVCRLKVSFNNVVKEFMASSSLDSEVYFTINKTESFINQSLSNSKKTATTYYTKVKKGDKVKVRLVKVLLPTGEIEVLATSLYDKNTINIADLSELYQMRWGVETILNSLKNQLQMMVFSGIKPDAILQEIYATIFVYNLRQILINEAQLVVNEYNEANKVQILFDAANEFNKVQIPADATNEAQIIVNEANQSQVIVNKQISKKKVSKKKRCKREQKINKNVAIGVLKPVIMKIFLEDNPKGIIDKLIAYFEKNKISKRKLAKNPPRQKSLAKRRNLVTQHNFRRAI